ncbi:MAG: peptide deformylase, partial [Pseudomonadota bacterium]|nr:peptide deformylase [Pseudomonadota bacterium]
AGDMQTRTVDGLLAVCIQHEIDHLKGRVFVDHLSQLKQTRIKSKLAKQARITA